MRTTLLLLTLAFTIGCNANPTPSDVRHDTAVATETVVKDTKAAAEGIKDGVKEGVKDATSPDRGPQGHPVDINKANRLTLMTLPGVTSKVATQIIANRPYAYPEELRTRGIVTSDEFDRIAPRIITID